MKTRKIVLSVFIALLLMIVVLAGLSFRSALASIFPPVFTIQMDRPVENAEFQLYYFLERGLNEKDSVRIHLASENATSQVSFRLPTTAASTVSLSIRGLQNIGVKSISYGTLQWAGEDMVRSYYPDQSVSRYEVKDGLVSISSIGNEISLKYFGNITDNFIRSVENLLITYLLILVA